MSNKKTKSTPVIEGKGITVAKIPGKGRPASSAIASIVLVGVVFLISSLIYNFVNRPVCSDELLQRAGSSITGTRPAQLNDIVREVESLNGYNKDSNCLYLVVKNSINNSETRKAELNYKKLTESYDSDTGFSKSLGKDLDSLSELKKQLDFLKSFDQATKTNYSGIKEP